MSKIELNTQEIEWETDLGGFEIGLNEDYNKRILKLETAGKLARSLLLRSAIPKVRLMYFKDASYNLGNTKISREEIFKKNGTSGDNILIHPHFLNYLKYFIYGSALSDGIINELSDLKASTEWDDDFVEQAFVILKRNFTGTRTERADYAQEVFKAFIDLQVSLADAKRLRDKIMKLTCR
ncbi:hypothetical protein [Dyadobacter bucti]|uniref:hypothetical protein n=1 Tax=Dyadobacter bucti TaxID=2572203 RepID=UPI003F7096D3